MFEGGLHPSLKWERHLLQVTPEHLGRRQLKRRGNRFLCTAYMWAVHSDFFFLIRDSGKGTHKLSQVTRVTTCHDKMESCLCDLLPMYPQIRSHKGENIRFQHWVPDHAPSRPLRSSKSGNI